jgi:hypothetical protein
MGDLIQLRLLCTSKNEMITLYKQKRNDDKKLSKSKNEMMMMTIMTMTLAMLLGEMK